MINVIFSLIAESSEYEPSHNEGSEFQEEISFLSSSDSDFSIDDENRENEQLLQSGTVIDTSLDSLKLDANSQSILHGLVKGTI